MPDLISTEMPQGPYGKYYNPVIAPLWPDVADALLAGGQAHELFLPPEQAASLLDPGYWPVETGYARMPDNGLSIFCLTPMPRVTPAMWDWWFGWHGCAAQRYRLWHPKAHIDARWADGRDDHAYVGRTSLITEYLGSECRKASISFVPPSRLGLDETRLAQQGEVAICARIGMPGTPLKGGWLLHQIRPVDGGVEMRSRMWMGGRHAAIGDNPGLVAKTLARLIRPFGKMLLPDPGELLTHNAQEMAHLAGFLPELYDAFGPDNKGDAP